MSKRERTEESSPSQKKGKIEKTPENDGTQQKEETEEDLVFEDPFEDDYEEESVDEEQQGNIGEENDEDVMEEIENERGMEERFKEEEEAFDEEEQEGSDEKNSKTKLWLPQKGLQPGQKLECDSDAYDMLHFFTVEWPCLSFSILGDNLGQQRTKYPHTLYLAAGTQAPNKSDNKIFLLKLSDLGKTRDSDSDSGFDPDNEDDDSVDTEPMLEHKSIPHASGEINRTRAMPQQPHIVATFAAESTVNIFDLKAHLNTLDKQTGVKLRDPQPTYTFNGHTTEGWGLAWCPRVQGRLISSDCASKIYLWHPTETDWSVDSTPFTGHTKSVEDLQWSPSQDDVFASSSVDKSVCFWDTRKGKQPHAVIPNSHSSDVNVISWNTKRAFLVLSGSDDGTVKVWDLRKLSGDTTQPQFSFSWHKQPITSVEWNPNDDSGFSCACEDDSVTIWDLSLDSPESTKIDEIDVPSQLLFVHQGQQHIKEVHWHKQIPGILVSTASDGFCVFKPNNTQ